MDKYVSTSVYMFTYKVFNNNNQCPKRGQARHKKEKKGGHVLLTLPSTGLTKYLSSFEASLASLKSLPPPTSPTLHSLIIPIPYSTKSPRGGSTFPSKANKSLSHCLCACVCLKVSDWVFENSPQLISLSSLTCIVITSLSEAVGFECEQKNKNKRGTMCDHLCRVLVFGQWIVQGS